MKVTELPNGKFAIKRGVNFFSFFVDHDRCSWSKHYWNARQFCDPQEAERDFAEIKRRDKHRREGAL